MVPHAQAMAEQLCKTFFQYASEVRHPSIPVHLSILPTSSFPSLITKECQPPRTAVIPSLLPLLLLLLSHLSSESQGDQDDDKALAASQCLDALNTLLQSVRDHKPILASCEQHVLPVLALVLGPDGA